MLCIEPWPPDGIGSRPSVRPTERVQAARPPESACIARLMHHALHIMHCTYAWAWAGSGFARRPGGHLRRSTCTNNGEGEG